MTWLRWREHGLLECCFEKNGHELMSTNHLLVGLFRNEIASIAG
jgi:hypothetical protein